MHCTARLVEMLERYSADLREGNPPSKDGFLMDEISALEESKGIHLQNFLPPGVFLNMLQKRVEAVSAMPRDFDDRLWDYVERVLIKVLMHHCDGYPQLRSSTRRAAQSLIAKKKQVSFEWVKEITGMEFHTAYTSNPEYIATSNKLISRQGGGLHGSIPVKSSKMNIEGIGNGLETAHLRSYSRNVAQQAFDLKMKMTAYWNIVLMRLVDTMASHIQFAIHKLVTNEMEEEIVAGLVEPKGGGGIERMVLDECLEVAEKRHQLTVGLCGGLFVGPAQLSKKESSPSAAQEQPLIHPGAAEEELRRISVVKESSTASSLRSATVDLLDRNRPRPRADKPLCGANAVAAELWNPPPSVEPSTAVSEQVSSNRSLSSHCRPVADPSPSADCLRLEKVQPLTKAATEESSRLPLWLPSIFSRRFCEEEEATENERCEKKEKREAVAFSIESRGQNKVVCAREKPRATGQTQDERAWKGLRGPVRGIYGSGSSKGASAKLPRKQWVKRTSIPAVGTSPENPGSDESYEEARIEEARLFQSHPLLSKIDKSIVSIPVLAQKLVRIQANIISKCLPEIVRKINYKLSANMADLNRLPQGLSSVSEALTAFMRILSSAKESLRKILIRGEFEEYPEEKEMHCTARMVEMLNVYSGQVQAYRFNFEGNNNFLMDGVMALEEAKEIGLPNFLPRGAFLSVLSSRVKGISPLPRDFVEKFWDYIEGILVKVLMHHSDSYPQLQSSMRRAAQNLIAKKKDRSFEWVVEIIGMEMLADYSCNPEYTTTWNKLMEKEEEFMAILNDASKSSRMKIDGVDVEIGHLRYYKDVVKQAFDLRMRLIAYWKIVMMRLVDSMALHILFSIHKLVNKDMEDEVVADLMAPHGGGIERMLEESPVVAEKRHRLTKSLKLLKESKDVVGNIMDRLMMNNE
ncbi:hypothetical protein DM860_008064 [Cuscuta australis]|uniref:GED domain-containing protein n=1 Tax=Cuscuta australis TaxID=267555 RepID=A0A328D3F8_9ASTE|nr:hypothetical protein DM860_008064 [Cuscuta australis]